MQLTELLETLVPIVLFIPSYLLTIVYIMEMWEKERHPRTVAMLGFLTYAPLSSYFLLWIGVNIFVLGLGMPMLGWVYDLYIISIFSLLGGGLIFLVLWSVALVRPEWLYAYSRTLAIVSFILWILYTASTTTTFTTQLHISYAISLLLFNLTFLFALYFAFLQTRSDRRAILLFTGLLLFYLTLVSQVFVTSASIRLHHITMFGLWLVLGWHILTRKESPQNKPRESHIDGDFI